MAKEMGETCETRATASEVCDLDFNYQENY